MFDLSLGRLTIIWLAVLSSTACAWPRYQWNKRQSADTPTAESEDLTFEEEYDFIIAGGKYALPRYLQQGSVLTMG